MARTTTTVTTTTAATPPTIPPTICGNALPRPLGDIEAENKIGLKVLRVFRPNIVGIKIPVKAAGIYLLLWRVEGIVFYVEKDISLCQSSIN